MFITILLIILLQLGQVYFTLASSRRIGERLSLLDVHSAERLRQDDSQLRLPPRLDYAALHTDLNKIPPSVCNILRFSNLHEQEIGGKTCD